MLFVTISFHHTLFCRLFSSRHNFALFLSFKQVFRNASCLLSRSKIHEHISSPILYLSLSYKLKTEKKLEQNKMFSKKVLFRNVGNTI